MNIAGRVALGAIESEIFGRNRPLADRQHDRFTDDLPFAPYLRRAKYTLSDRGMATACGGSNCERNRC